MSLDGHLVLNRWLDSQFGAEDSESSKSVLVAQEEGPSGDGRRLFFRALAGRRGKKLAEEKLREYDARVVDYEARLARARSGLRFD